MSFRWGPRATGVLPSPDVCVLRFPVVSDSLCPMDCSPPGSSVHGDSPGKNTGVGCHFLLRRIFPTLGLNPCLLMSPALAGEFFIPGATWEAPSAGASGFSPRP